MAKLEGSVQGVVVQMREVSGSSSRGNVTVKRRIIDIAVVKIGFEVRKRSPQGCAKTASLYSLRRQAPSYRALQRPTRQIP